MQYTIAIPSLGRADVAARHPLLKHAILVVHEDELDQYKERCSAAKGIVAHSVRGISPTRNFIVEHVRRKGDKFVFMVDDDFQYVMGQMSLKNPVYYDAETIRDIITQTGRMALDAGAGIFGYGLSGNPREVTALEPINWRGWVRAAAMGIVDKELRFDEDLLSKEDIDICLQSVQKHRIVLRELRFHWRCNAFTLKGGMQRIRSREIEDECMEYLRTKWGSKIISWNRNKRTTGQGITIHLS